jgi:hypothetical protein
MNKTDELPLICMAYDFAAELSQAEPDPRGWTDILVRLLQKLESESAQHNLDPDHAQAILETYAQLKEALSERLESGHW